MSPPLPHSNLLLLQVSSLPLPIIQTTIYSPTPPPSSHPSRTPDSPTTTSASQHGNPPPPTIMFPAKHLQHLSPQLHNSKYITVIIFFMHANETLVKEAFRDWIFLLPPWNVFSEGYSFLLITGYLNKISTSSLNVMACAGGIYLDTTKPLKIIDCKPVWGK